MPKLVNVCSAMMNYLLLTKNEPFKVNYLLRINSALTK